ncbi:MAG: quinone-dependent dihydroorotate dehydrogenase [Myxococcota bacterium]
MTGLLDRLMIRGLFMLPSEASHDAALRMLSTAEQAPGGLAALRGLYGSAESLTRPAEVFGLTFPNRVGLAAGYDKNAVAWRGLAALGFGHVEVGTVTPLPQAGNPKPRVFRLERDRSVINRLGFPSEGSAAVRARLSADRPGGMILGVNLGKNKATPLEESGADYVSLVKDFASVADYLTVNISSPNTPGLRRLQTGSALRTLLEEVIAARNVEANGKHLPVLVKLSPDLEAADLLDAVEAIGAAGVDGIITSNTTLSREGLVDTQKVETGGCSGDALTERSRTMLGHVLDAAQGLEVVSVGGIMTTDEAKRRLDMGAALVQVYTGVIYNGPSWVGELARTL